MQKRLPKWMLQGKGMARQQQVPYVGFAEAAEL